MTIENTPKITDDQHVNDMRSALEHRATWFYLLLEEAERAGLDWEAVGRAAVTRCGVLHGNTKFTKTKDLKAFGMGEVGAAPLDTWRPVACCA